MATARENEVTVRRFLEEIWSQGNLQTAEEILDPNFLFILAFARIEGIESFKKLVVTNRGAFQNLTYTAAPNDIVADESKGASYWTMTSKHVGTWRNVPGSNKDVSIQGITFYRFSPEGKITEARVQNDVLGLMRQIGGVKMIYEG